MKSSIHINLIKYSCNFPALQELGRDPVLSVCAMADP